jgi:uncharacterized integral membrane protein
MKSAGALILSLGTIFVFIVGLLNWVTAPFNLLGLSLNLPLGVLLIAGYILGFICTFGLLISQATARTASTQRLAQWQLQDEKLLTQVQSDREKQLEAKIQTLETALQRALDKRS